MVTRARIVRAYYEIRAKADEAAAEAKRYRAESDSGLSASDAEAEFHIGRQCGMLTALNILTGALEEGEVS
jgi:hypothetical protein